MKRPELANPWRQETGEWLPRAGSRGWRVTANGYIVSLEEDSTVLELDSGDGGTAP